jgi:hypothetical protein
LHLWLVFVAHVIFPSASASLGSFLQNECLFHILPNPHLGSRRDYRESVLRTGPGSWWEGLCTAVVLCSLPWAPPSCAQWRISAAWGQGGDKVATF